MYKFSIFSWFGFPIPIQERFRLIKSAGFDGVLLWWSHEFADIDGDKALQPEMARKNGLIVENIHTPIFRNNGLWDDNSEGEACEKILAECINDCAIYEIPTAVVHLTRGNNPPPVNQAGLDRIKRLVDIAEKKSVNIALENLRRPDYLDYVFINIQSERLGFCYDSGHENCYTRGRDFLPQYGSKLMALHLHDNDGTDDQHLLPGKGELNWESVMKKIAAARYNGPVALEITNEFSKDKEENDAEMFLGRAYKAANY